MSVETDQTSQTDKIENAFEQLVDIQSTVETVLRTPKGRDHIGVRDMLRIIAGPQTESAKEQLSKISTNFLARRQFKAILQSQALASQAQQAAAASVTRGDQKQRSGNEFDLNLIPSTKDDGLFYLQLKVKNDQNLLQISRADVLFAESKGVFSSLPLPKIMDGVAQIMIKQGHPILDAFHDPEAEFFIK